MEAPAGCSAWWSPGATTAHAGVGVVVKDNFLKHFDANPRWVVILPGRACRLELRGEEGALDILVVYFPTGANITEHDTFGFRDSEINGVNTFQELRARMRSRLAGAIAPKTTALTILGGDFNWVKDDKDRYTATSAVSSGNRDRREESHFANMVADPKGLVGNVPA